MQEEKIYIHYGHKKYEPSMFSEIKNRQFIKPFGGLWASDINAEYGWKNWCKDNDFRECNEDNSFKFKLKEGSKVLVLKTKEDLKGLPQDEDSPIWLEKNLLNDWGSVYLDFEKLKEQYDAIEVYIDELYWKFYGWDCDSLLVLNKECIEVV